MEVEGRPRKRSALRDKAAWIPDGYFLCRTVVLMVAYIGPSMVVSRYGA